MRSQRKARRHRAQWPFRPVSRAEPKSSMRSDVSLPAHAVGGVDEMRLLREPCSPLASQVVAPSAVTPRSSQTSRCAIAGVVDAKAHARTAIRPEARARRSRKGHQTSLLTVEQVDLGARLRISDEIDPLATRRRQRGDRAIVGVVRRAGERARVE